MNELYIREEIERQLPLALAEVLDPIVRHNADRVLRRYRRWAVAGFLVLVVAFGLLYANLKDQASEIHDQAKENSARIAELKDLTNRITVIEHPSPAQFRSGIVTALRRCARDPVCRRLFHRVAARAAIARRASLNRLTPHPGPGPGSGRNGCERCGGNSPSRSSPTASPGPTPRHHGGGSSSGPPPRAPAPSPSPPLINVNTPPAPVVCTFVVGVNCP